MGPSKTESENSGNGHFTVKENSVAPTPKYIAGIGTSSHKFSSAKRQIAFEMDGLEDFLDLSQVSHVDPATFRKLILPVYKNAGQIPNEAHHLAIPAGDCLTVGRTAPSLLIARFHARLQILLECFPQLWIFRAKEDINEVHVWAANIVGIDLDREVVARFAINGCYIFDKTIGFPTPSLARLLAQSIEVFFKQGHCSQRVFWTEVEEFISLVGQTHSEHTIEDSKEMAEWIRLFDTEYYAIAQRLTVAWVKAAELVMSSTYDGMRSLALVFADENLLPESLAHNQEESESLRFQAMAEDQNHRASPSENNQSEPYHSKNVDMTGAGPGIRTNALPADGNPVETIWQKIYISTLLPQCERFCSNPPSGSWSRYLEATRLEMLIEGQVLTRLDFVDVKRDQALKRQRKDLIKQARKMLSTLRSEQKKAFQ